MALAVATGIEPGCLLTQQEFCLRMGFGRKAFVEARRKGLPVRKVSRRIYIDTDEARQWMRRQPLVGAAT
jgi:hypothetical protein